MLCYDFFTMVTYKDRKKENIYFSEFHSNLKGSHNSNPVNFPLEFSGHSQGVFYTTFGRDIFVYLTFRQKKNKEEAETNQNVKRYETF